MVDNKREQTLRQRLGELVSSWYESPQYLPRARHVQLNTTEEEWQGIIELAKRANHPAQYFHRLISKERLDSTLKHVRRLLKRSVEAMSYVARKISNRTKTFLNFVGDKIAEGKYPMNQVVNMVEIACSKKQPDRYLIGILKKGYEHAAPKVHS